MNTHEDAPLPRALVGLSGWAYPNWRGKFYPKGLPQRLELSYVAQRFSTLELNSTFYRLQRPSTYIKWADAAPEQFVFAVKGWRQITHFERLKDPRKSLAAFFGSGVLSLGSKLGPILWQLPPSLAFDEETLRAFFDVLPRTFGEAAELVAAHSEGTPNDDPHALFGYAHPSTRIKYALEPRNSSFDDIKAAALLSANSVAMVIADSAGKHPLFDQVTADFMYLRLHGSPRLYYSNYSPEALAEWAQKIESWKKEGILSYVYFDNSGAGHSPYNALELVGFLDSNNQET